MMNVSCLLDAKKASEDETGQIVNKLVRVMILIVFIVACVSGV
jgi:hypothetical protein